LPSYRTRIKPTYAPRRKGISSIIHANFRETWDKGIDEALKQASRIARKGWTVDLRLGALTKNQAERVAQRLGPEVDIQLIPVATWMGEEIVLLAYKEKPKPKPKKKVEKTVPGQPITADKLYERFIKIARKGEEPDSDEYETYWKEGGYLMDQYRVMAVVRKDVSEGFASQRETIMSGQYLHYGLKVDSNLISKVREAKKQGVRNIRVGGNVVNIDNFIKALRVLKGLEIELRGQPESPLWLVEPKSGHAVVIAPVLDPVEMETKNLSEIL